MMRGGHIDDLSSFMIFDLSTFNFDVWHVENELTKCPGSTKIK